MICINKRRRTEDWNNFREKQIPAITICWTSIGLMIAHRLLRWPSINPTSGERPVFTWLHVFTVITLLLDSWTSL